MNTIIHLIRQQKLNNVQRDKINKVLYICYEKMAIKEAILFKKTHHYKCKSIHNEDLILSGKAGLFYSINKYNGYSSFINFVRFYIKIELLKTLTNHYSLSNIPKYIRMKSKKNFTQYELYKYKKNLEPYVLDYDMINNMYVPKQESLYQYKEMWEKINCLDNFSKRIIYLKYDFEFNKIRSNSKISELMCCSKEHIRKKIKNIILS
jgi:DNA-directed RNA polymerase sigma subunit (sigma70/sigma32)